MWSWRKKGLQQPPLTPLPDSLRGRLAVRNCRLPVPANSDKVSATTPSAACARIYGSRTHCFPDVSSVPGTCIREGTMSTKEAPANGRGEEEALRRMRNDLIAKGAEAFDTEDSCEFLCECGDGNCKEVVELTVAQYRCARFWPVVAHVTPQAA